MAAVFKSAGDGTIAAKRAGYVIPVNSFHDKGKQKPHSFEAQRQLILGDIGHTEIIPLDLSATMGLTYMATTHTMLASYLTIQPSDALRVHSGAISVVLYVLRGHGTSTVGGETVAWGPNDALVMPGNVMAEHRAGDEPCVLFSVTDSPFLNYAGIQSLAIDQQQHQLIHYRFDEIRKYLDVLDASGKPAGSVGRAVILTDGQNPTDRSTTPIIKSNVNTLEPGCDQRPHRHNGAALTLCIEGEGCHSMIDGVTVPWAPFGVMLTPACALHSHHNRGSKTMFSFVVQDSSLYKYTRAQGFAFGD